jgi:hypothetical protein
MAQIHELNLYGELVIHDFWTFASVGVCANEFREGLNFEKLEQNFFLTWILGKLNMQYQHFSG